MLHADQGVVIRDKVFSKLQQVPVQLTKVFSSSASSIHCFWIARLRKWLRMMARMASAVIASHRVAEEDSIGSQAVQIRWCIQKSDSAESGLMPTTTVNA